MGSWNFVWLIMVSVDSLLLIVHCWLSHFPSMLLSYLPELIFQAQKLLLTGSNAVTTLKLVRIHFLCQIKKRSTRSGVKAFGVYFRVAASKDKGHTTFLILSLFSANADLGSSHQEITNKQSSVNNSMNRSKNKSCFHKWALYFSMELCHGFILTRSIYTRDKLEMTTQPECPGYFPGKQLILQKAAYGQHSFKPLKNTCRKNYVEKGCRQLYEIHIL